MESTYLIQRLQKPYKQQEMLQKFGNSFSFGGGLVNGGISQAGMDLICDIFRFDYMGAAEFEFGAVPKALAKIVSTIKDYEKGFFKIKTHSIYYICHKDHKDEVKKRIKILAKNDYNRYAQGMGLKEVALLKSALEGKRHNYSGWLELDNAFMFFVDEEMYNKTVKLFFEKEENL